MRTTIYCTLALLLMLPATAQQKPAPDKQSSKVREFTVDWTGGEIELVLQKAGRYDLSLTAGTGKPRVGLSSDALDLHARRLSATVQPATKGPKKQPPWVSSATARGEVMVRVVQADAQGEKTTVKIRCDQAIFTGGSKPRTGRITFSGSCHLSATGTLELETDTSSGWIDLGDPNDDTKPLTVHLDSGSTTGRIKDKGTS